ncbi:MAG: hypothetical protein ACRYGA_14530 [Janthinobacterium lividum]
MSTPPMDFKVRILIHAALACRCPDRHRRIHPEGAGTGDPEHRTARPERFLQLSKRLQAVTRAANDVEVPVLSLSARSDKIDRVRTILRRSVRDVVAAPVVHPMPMPENAPQPFLVDAPRLLRLFVQRSGRRYTREACVTDRGGLYGARTSRDVEGDPRSSVMYVGMVGIGKPTRSFGLRDGRARGLRTGPQEFVESQRVRFRHRRFRDVPGERALPAGHRCRERHARPVRGCAGAGRTPGSPSHRFAGRRCCPRSSRILA